VHAVVDWVDRSTAAAPDTHGNFSSPPYVPALLIAGIEGFALRGPLGIATSAAAAVSSVYVEHKTGSNLLGVATGITVGAAMAAVTFPAANVPHMVMNAVTGGLLGGFQAYRCNKIADVRGAGTMGALVSALFARGPAKVAGGIAAAATAHFAGKRSPWTQAAAGAALGATLGAGLALAGFAPVGVGYFVAISALSGGVGPILGPRYSQLFRNLSKNFGTRMEAGLRKARLVKHPLKERVRNCLGALPAGATKEGVTGLLYADGHLAGLVAGTLVEAIHLTAVFMLMDGHDKSAPAPSKPE